MRLNLLYILILFMTPAFLSASLSGKKICIDPGHGGGDIGAPGYDGSAYPNEADFVLDIGINLEEQLKKHGAKVSMTRKSKKRVSLANRVSFANNNSVNLFMSIHLNSNAKKSANGTETFAYSRGGNSERAAKAVQDELIKSLGRKNRGVKFAGFYVLRKTWMTAELSEGLFVSNQEEFNIIKSSETRKKHSEALYRAACSYYGDKPIDSKPYEKSSVKGFIFNASSGKGNSEDNRIQGAKVEFWNSEKNIKRETVTSSNGLFKFPSITSGTYTLTVSADSFDSFTDTIDVSGGGTVWSSRGIEESITLGNGVIKGFVYNSSNGNGNVDGNRIEAAAINVTDSYGTLFSTESDENGLFVISDIPAGDYTMKVSASDFETDENRIALAAGITSWISTGLMENKIAGYGNLKGFVFNESSGWGNVDGNRVIDAFITISHKSLNFSKEIKSNEAGLFIIENIPEGDYGMTVSAANFYSKTEDFSILQDSDTWNSSGLAIYASGDGMKAVISGPISPKIGDFAIYTVHPTGFSGTLNYKWFAQLTSLGDPVWYEIGDEKTFSYVMTADIGTFVTLGATITDSSGKNFITTFGINITE